MSEAQHDDASKPEWKTRLVEGAFPDRQFDIEFWQEQGDEAIFSAAWERWNCRTASMAESQHDRELLRALNSCDVEYLIVG